MLLNVAARYGVRVQSLQHVLEGYKVAAEIAAHGASASTFSDWWAYKIEAYDAIPYNAALLTQAGVSVCIKSDSEELIRHLYLEAAKMVKYGGVTETQALAMITINPARELGLDARLGSIEVGKDADIALFNAHPFDGFARCELALIDGEVWFQRPEKDGQFAPRPGDHTTMPAPSQRPSGRETLEILRNPKGVYALVGATLHPVTGPDIAEGTLVIRRRQDHRDRRPRDPHPALGRGDRRPGSRRLARPDRRGHAARPLRDRQPARDAGLRRLGAVPARAPDQLALHPDSELIPVTRANGVLTTYVQPAGGLISGPGLRDRPRRLGPSRDGPGRPVALNVNIPPHVSPREAPTPRRRRRGDGPTRGSGARSGSTRSRRSSAAPWPTTRSGPRRRPGRRLGPPRPQARRPGPLRQGEKPVIFRAEHRDEILDALKIAET